MPRHEKYFVPEGITLIAGIDEAGRGPLAGPVVAAAVMLPEDCSLPGLDDSKRLTPLERNHLLEEIGLVAVGIGIGMASSDEIDRYNILESTRLAAMRALERLDPAPEYILTDALSLKGLIVPHLAIIRGDQRCRAISAASVVAKVFRDMLMLSYNMDFPEYAFSEHKGYGTRSHMEALLKRGSSTIHRLSFQGVCWFKSTLVHSFLFSNLQARITAMAAEGGVSCEFINELEALRAYLPPKEYFEILGIISRIEVEKDRD